MSATALFPEQSRLGALFKAGSGLAIRSFQGTNLAITNSSVLVISYLASSTDFST